ncbi:MAG: chorismate-binding protein [Chloroflexota bacterium]
MEQVEAVREAIAQGEIYQATLTRRLETLPAGDPWPLFRLRTGDPAFFGGHGSGRRPDCAAPRALLSASPEPFLAVDAHGNVSTDPIKARAPAAGPATRTATSPATSRQPGDQAENVMIVDVLRNDLGRVCVPGTVRVPRLLRLERTAAVQHLVTTVTAGLPRRTRTPSTCSVARSWGGSITVRSRSAQMRSMSA